MIKLKALGDFEIRLKQVGALTVANNVDAAIIPDDGFLVAVLCRSGVISVNGGTTSGLIDVNVNGTTVLASVKVTFSHTAASKTPSSYGNFTTLAPIAVSKGDVLSIDVDQTFDGGTAPVNVCFDFVFRRKQSGPALIVTDEVIQVAS